jgi:hypothetical protein
MARNTTAVRILIASPSDVEHERKILADAISRWNAANSKAVGVVLEAIRWETHAHPATGEHPQEIINQQIVDDSDMVVGVFWSRLGTATPGGPSGTVEEIERLRKRNKRVLLYFSLAAIPQGHDPEQFRRLQEYKQTLKEGTLFWQFRSLEDLDQMFSQHLAAVANELAKELKAEPRSTSERVPSVVTLKPLPGPRFMKPDDSDTWREIERKNAFLGAVAIFRTEPIAGASLSDIDGLKAQITFYESAGGEVQRVHHGCWLGDPFNHTRLSASGTAELIIAVDAPDLAVPFAIENTRSNAAHYEYEGTKYKQLDRRLYDINVRLIGDARGASRLVQVVADFHFNLDLREEEPILRLGWTR